MAFGLPLTLPDASYADTPSLTRGSVPGRGHRDRGPGPVPVYRGKRIRNLTVGKSPDWLRHRLLAVASGPSQRGGRDQLRAFRAGTAHARLRTGTSWRETWSGWPWPGTA
jgi:hypothetical protein